MDTKNVIAAISLSAAVIILYSLFFAPAVVDQKDISNKYLTIFFKKLSDKNNNRLNISFVAKKKIGNAVTRNRIKRRLRNIMNEGVKSININLNYCYLLIARISVSKDPYETIKNATLEDFKKIK